MLYNIHYFPDTKRIVTNMPGNQNIITGIIQKKRKSNCLVYVDNQLLFEISLDLVMKYRLSKGFILDSETEKIINEEQRIINLKQTAYSFATYKPRTEKQVSDRLHLKGFTTEEINTAINFLGEFNYLDDEKYAYTFVKEYIKRKPCSRLKLTMELSKRGINKSLTEKAVDSVLNIDNISFMAQTLAEKKMNSLKNKPVEKQKQSLINYLQRQGFDWGTIKSVTNKEFPK